MILFNLYQWFNLNSAPFLHTFNARVNSAFPSRKMRDCELAHTFCFWKLFRTFTGKMTRGLSLRMVFSLLFQDTLFWCTTLSLFCFQCFSGVPAWRLMQMYSITVGFSQTLYCGPNVISIGEQPAFKCHEEVLYLQPCSHLNVLTFSLPNRGMLRRSRCALIFL